MVCIHQWFVFKVNFSVTPSPSPPKKFSLNIIIYCNKWYIYVINKSTVKQCTYFCVYHMCHCDFLLLSDLTCDLSLTFVPLL